MKRFVLLAVWLLWAVSAAFGQSSENRYKKELAFPLHMGVISIGVSPTIWDQFMIHDYKDIGTGVKVTLPPIHLGFEQSVWDMGNAGAFGYAASLTYGRYKYSYPWVDNQVNVKIGMIDLLVGPSYHYTVATRFEVYLRAMAGFTVSNHKNDSPGVNHGWNSKFISQGIAGARYYFTDTWGVFVEGGYATGIVNGGLSLRW